MLLLRQVDLLKTEVSKHVTWHNLSNPSAQCQAQGPAVGTGSSAAAAAAAAFVSAYGAAVAAVAAESAADWLVLSPAAPCLFAQVAQSPDSGPSRSHGLVGLVVVLALRPVAGVANSPEHWQKWAVAAAVGQACRLDSAL
mmetsp:Transcript_36919/g.79539  ORF Transcript_36919/g.79539 Transcript_36919/m.79539 type:complete len:140 (+) Transcript_36919:229-648(+)